MDLKTIGTLAGVAVIALALCGCGYLTQGATAVATPATAYKVEAGLKVIASAAETAASAGRIHGHARDVALSAAQEIKRDLPIARQAFDSKDYIGAALQFAALAAPAAQVQAATTGQAQPSSTSGDIAAGIAFLAGAAATYGEAQAVLKGDPANLPAALTQMRGEVDAQLDRTIAALQAAPG